MKLKKRKKNGKKALEAKKKVQTLTGKIKTRRTGNISSWAAKFADSIVTAVGSLLKIQK